MTTAFTTRIELHGAQGTTYDELHASMKKAGFIRELPFTGGKKYELPTAEYNLYKASATAATVLEMAKKATASVWNKQFSVLVTQTEEPRAHFGLKEL